MSKALSLNDSALFTMMTIERKILPEQKRASLLSKSVKYIAKKFVSIGRRWRTRNWRQSVNKSKWYLHNFLQIIVAKTTHGSDVEGEHGSKEDMALPHVSNLPSILSDSFSFMLIFKPGPIKKKYKSQNLKKWFYRSQKSVLENRYFILNLGCARYNSLSCLRTTL